FQVIAAMIRWSCFYLGSESGMSWLATTTGTPMAVFIDPDCRNRLDSGLSGVLRGEKYDIQEWDIYTGLQTVLAHLESRLPAEIGRIVRVYRDDKIRIEQLGQVVFMD